MHSLKNERSGFHVPVPLSRPGDRPDFDDIVIPSAGAMPCPDVFATAESVRDHAFGLVRVLDDDGGAVGEWARELPAEVMLSGLQGMMLTRAYDNRMLRVQRQGKTSFYMKSTGEEAVAVAAALALNDDDMCFPTYRQQGILIARGWPLVDMMNQVLSNSGDRLKGRQMPVFYSTRKGGFFSISGNLGTQFSQAVGWALGAAADGDSRIAAAWIGEGATAEGDFHYALTFASVYQAPVVLTVVNNQWAISSFSGIAGAERSTFASRGIGYGIPSFRVDGNDFLAVHAVTAWAAQRARGGMGPTLIEMFTYRSEGHSTSDDPTKYRAPAEARHWPLGDPIERLKLHLIRRGLWDEDRHAELEIHLSEEVRKSLKMAEKFGTLNHQGPVDPTAMFEDVFKQMPPHLVVQLAQAKS